MRVAFQLLALLGLPGLLNGQLVRGRVVGGDDSLPISRALVELHPTGGGAAARAVTSPSGTFAIIAPSAGRYTLRVAAIGYSPINRPAFDVPAEGLRLGDITMQSAAVTLADLQVFGSEGACRAIGAGGPVLGRLLEGARTSLSVMEASLKGSEGFRIEAIHRTALAGRFDSVITADTVRGLPVSWPISAVDPDSIRKVGFMADGIDGFQDSRVWYGPDVSVLSADWFLESHCFALEPDRGDTTTITLRFEPAGKGKLVDIAGTLVLDRASLALKELTFQHRNMPGGLRNGLAGGEMRFAPLPSGLWLPTWWRIFAPAQLGGRGRAIGIDERQGRLIGVDPGGGGSDSTMHAALPLRFTVPRADLAPPDSVTDFSHYRAAVSAACPARVERGRTALLAEEGLVASRARKGRPTADQLFQLACLRARLDIDEAIGREGYLMPLGTSWQHGATNAALLALTRGKDDYAIAELLAVIALDQPEPDEAQAVRDALAKEVTGGVTAPAAVRGCALLSLRLGDLAASNQCITVGLQGGGDSTWQLLHLARLASRSADTATVSTLLDAAMAVARQPSDWAEVGWHLRWFLEPGEWEAWQAMADSTRGAFVRDELARRDVRDGRRAGSRLVEHFTRLDYAEAHFLREMPRKLRGFSQVAATPDKRSLDPDAVRYTSAPESIPAQTFRVYLPSVEWIDDRGAVYLRFGEPTKKAIWVDTAAGSVLEREAWRYDLDGRNLLVSFESEAYDGSNEATRLVPGVLGNFFCGLDTPRCQLTNRLICWDIPPSGCDPTGSGWSPITPERLETLRTEDRSEIAIATTKDDNSLRVAHPVEGVAHFASVWDPSSGAPLAVIDYALKSGDLAFEDDSAGKIAAIDLAFRQWSRATEQWLDTSLRRRLRFAGVPGKDQWVTGYVVIPSRGDVTTWSLVATQPDDRRLRAWGDRPPLGTSYLRLSDLVLGAASQHETWTTTTGTSVPLAPLGTFDKAEPVSVYWQARSDVAREGVAITVRLFAVGVRGEKPAIEVGFTTDLKAGINELDRLVGIDRLDKGEYRLEIAMHGQDGAEASRSARLLVR